MGNFTVASPDMRTPPIDKALAASIIPDDKALFMIHRHITTAATTTITTETLSREAVV